MRYLVKARGKPGRSRALLEAIEQGSLGKGCSVAGDEYLRNMREARVGNDGAVRWVETCFCAEPLAEERPYWENYFELVTVRDAHARRNCRDFNGSEPWACCDCDCTRRLEQRLHSRGNPFLEDLQRNASSDGPPWKLTEGKHD